MHWYLVHTKLRQEKCALLNLEQQGYECYLPLLPAEKLRQGALTITQEPLFPRYLFIRLGTGDSLKSWAPIRSTKGVSRLVSFGIEPAKVDNRLIDLLKAEEVAMQKSAKRLFMPGEHVRVIKGAFSGIEGIYQMADGDRRVLVLIELLSKPITVHVPPTAVCKAN